jgi:hypothetical protein
VSGPFFEVISGSPQSSRSTLQAYLSRVSDARQGKRQSGSGSNKPLSSIWLAFCMGLIGREVRFLRLPSREAILWKPQGSGGAATEGVKGVKGEKGVKGDPGAEVIRDK